MDDHAEQSPLSGIKLYTPIMAGFAAFLGGPLAAGILTGINYRRMGRPKDGYLAFAIGAAATVFLFWSLFQIPPELMARVPSLLIPAIYAPLCGWFVSRLQGEEIRTVVEATGKQASAWGVAGWGIFSLFATMVPVLAFIALSPPFGFEGQRHIYGGDPPHLIFYQGDIDPETLDALGAHLAESGYFPDDHPSAAELRKEPDRYTLTIPIRRPYWDDEELLEGLRSLRDEIAASVLHDRVRLVLVDMEMNEIHYKPLD